MPAVDYEHCVIVGNVLGEIAGQLRGRPAGICGSNMRIYTPTNLFTYADGLVVDVPRFLDERRMNLLNPTLIFELLSPSTEAYDRGRKFEHYQSIESLREYLLVSSDRVGVTLYRRKSESEWVLIMANSLDSCC